MTGNRRFQTAQIICDQMLSHNVTRVHGTAREIACSLEVSGTRLSSISSLLMFIKRNHIRTNRFGFYISETQTFKKSGYPHQYTIELMDRHAGSPLPS